MLFCLGYVGFGVWPLAFVAWVPLWQALETSRSCGWRRAALLGFVFAWVAHAGGYRWLWRLVEVFLGGDVLLGGALWLAHSAFFATGHALQALGYRALRARGFPVAVSGLAPLVTLEWLYPAIFPVHLGDTLVDHLALVQIVDLGGPLLASALVALVNAALFETWRWRRGERPRPARPWLLAALAVALAWAYGTARSEALTRAMAGAPVLRVGLVQGNLGVLEKRREAVVVHRRYLEQSRELLAGAELDLLVWPETVYSGGLSLPLPISGELIREELRVPLLFGAATVRTEAGSRRKYNSALLIGADGVIRTAYDKNLPVPFAERVPFAGLVPAIAALFPHAQEFGAGSDTPPLALGDVRISTPICSESAEPAFVRGMVARADPGLIVSLANDAWFGDSQEPWIHLAVARLRAVEHKRALVHATNSGVSAVVDPLGRVLARSGLLTRETLTASVPLLEGRTLYTRLGDWPGWLALAALLLGLVRRRRPRGGPR